MPETVLILFIVLCVSALINILTDNEIVFYVFIIDAAIFVGFGIFVLLKSLYYA
jgi:hypothetical protein